ncbi:hypothetical protein FN976_07950 [Caenimonas sedimenti]|uniref:KfrA N-terminal DNA-binding domain-containing protein n=1 Tax=Caenimonas sedimenti TaxID=2596921 RepID=A0A562ZUT2_9BURK|nr:hypothetical protein FN976_07950 [Caenimonas sedimenti]
MHYEEVSAAAEALEREGQSVSVRALRARIGGSPNDITPLLATWRSKGGGRQSAGRRRPKKQSMQRSVWSLGAAASARTQSKPV